MQKETQAKKVYDVEKDCYIVFENEKLHRIETEENQKIIDDINKILDKIDNDLKKINKNLNQLDISLDEFEEEFRKV